jgi:ATP-dependent Clp protease ATP-binding subunit ClpX
MGRRNASCSFCRKNYRDVGPLVEGPGDVYICGECIELCQSIIDQEKRRRGQGRQRADLPPPEVVRAALDQIVTVEDEAKDALVEAAQRQGPQRHVLLIGPSPSSKMLLVRALAHALRVPFAEGDGSSLVRPAGAEIEPLLYRLLGAVGLDAASAEHGVVYVDGVDDPTTQEHLQRLWEGPRRSPGNSLFEIDPTRPLFVCGGQFANLDGVIEQMGRHPEQSITAQALLRWGMPLALVSRFAFFVRADSLGEQMQARLVRCANLDWMAQGDGAEH